jgi:hypothetical protein
MTTLIGPSLFAPNTIYPAGYIGKPLGPDIFALTLRIAPPRNRRKGNPESTLRHPVPATPDALPPVGASVPAAAAMSSRASCRALSALGPEPNVVSSSSSASAGDVPELLVERTEQTGLLHL